MAKYEKGDIVTYWFIVCETESGSRHIQGWSDNKTIVKAYMEFHSCPDFTVKCKTGSIERMIEIVNHNANDEIQIVNIATRDPEAKKGRNKLKLIAIPMTGTEKMFIDDDTANFLNSAIQYSYINSALPYLKDEYQKVLDSILLTDIIQKVVHHRTSKRISYLDIDQLLLLLRIPDSHFGL